MSVSEIVTLNGIKWRLEKILDNMGDLEDCDVDYVKVKLKELEAYIIKMEIL